jgi:hypothetical protein
MGTPDDIELLRIEAETCWESDADGRLTRARRPEPFAAPYVLHAVCGSGSATWFGVSTPEGLIPELKRHLGSAGAPDPSVEPRGLRECAAMLEGAVGWRLEIAGGPSYLVLPQRGTTPDAHVLTPASAGGPPARPEGDAWTAEEWSRLTGGMDGPWAVAVLDGRTVSVCHCSRLAPRGVEAGVWTAAEYRGRGLAGAVTAAWAEQLAADGRYIFYSTSADNRASRRVATKLGLREIGWMWSIRRL